MDALDSRHGTEAGNSAHMRDGEKSCAPCRAARGKADKRRRVYGSGLVLIPADVLQTIERYSVRTIELHTGLSGCTINNIRKHGDRARVKPSTVARVRAMRVPTDIGVIRRVRALARLGWSSPEMAARAGIPSTTVARLRDHDERLWVGNQRIRAAIAKAYDEMSMTVPPLTRHTSKLANRAAARGWAPPLAWDDIDDPAEIADGWERADMSRDEMFAHLIEEGASFYEVLSSLDLNENALEKWCDRNGHRKTFNVLARVAWERDGRYCGNCQRSIRSTKDHWCGMTREGVRRGAA
jgi:hypothetical protein